MTFGEKIVFLRKSKGMSQDQLAELLGVTRQSVSKWERDEVVADTDRILALSKLFGVSCDYLLDTGIEEPLRNSTFATSTATQAATSTKKPLTSWQRNWYWLGLLPLLWGLIDLITLYNFMRSYTSIQSFWRFLKLSFLALQEPYFESASVLILFIAFLYAVIKIGFGIFLILYGRKRVRKSMVDTVK